MKRFGERSLSATPLLPQSPSFRTCWIIHFWLLLQLDLNDECHLAGPFIHCFLSVIKRHPVTWASGMIRFHRKGHSPWVLVRPWHQPWGARDASQGDWRATKRGFFSRLLRGDSCFKIKCASWGAMVSLLAQSVEGQALVQREAHLANNNCHSSEHRQGLVFSPLTTPISFFIAVLGQTPF